MTVEGIGRQLDGNLDRALGVFALILKVTRGAMVRAFTIPMSRARCGSFAGIFVCMIALFGCAGRRPVISSAPPVVNPAPAPELTPQPAPTQPLPSPSAAQPPTGSAPSAPSIYVEQGTASWYGLPFHGRRAANGEIFDMNTLVAAHRTLPFGSILRVTNLNNGRQIEVRVIDRGPFVGDRVLDLARAAAIGLDMIGTGTAPIMSSPIAAARARSKTRSPTKGPRSMTRTSIWRPLFRLVTRRILPNGSVRWAATSVFISKISPLAARRPWKGRPYHDAVPCST